MIWPELVRINVLENDCGRCGINPQKCVNTVHVFVYLHHRPTISLAICRLLTFLQKQMKGHVLLKREK